MEVYRMDLKKRSKKQRQEDVKYLAGLPLTELRKRQSLLNKQKEQIYTHYVSLFERGLSTSKADQVMDNLIQMEQDLFEAVDKKTFSLKGRRK